MKIIPNKYIFLLGLLMLCLSGVSIILHHQGLASRLLTFAFWILSLATVQYLWEIRKNAK